MVVIYCYLERENYKALESMRIIPLILKLAPPSFERNPPISTEIIQVPRALIRRYTATPKKIFLGEKSGCGFAIMLKTESVRNYFF